MIEHVDQKMFESLVATGHARGVLSLDEVEAILGGDCDRQTVDDVVEVIEQYRQVYGRLVHRPR